MILVCGSTTREVTIPTQAVSETRWNCPPLPLPCSTAIVKDKKSRAKARAMPAIPVEPVGKHFSRTLHKKAQKAA